MKFTVLGSTGFIGRSLTRYLKAEGYEVVTPPRDVKDLRGHKSGHVIYAIGLTGNFRQRPEATVEAHVNVLQKLLNGAEFDSWLYLSSTRVYSALTGDVSASEYTDIPIRSGPDALYDASKLQGEDICLELDHPGLRVVRLSNVYGKGQSEHTFLGSVIADLNKAGKVTLEESPDSAKDYVSVEDVVKILPLIAMKGQDRLYNVASGRNITHRILAEKLRAYGYDVDFKADAPTRAFPVVDISRVLKEFGVRLRSLLEDLPTLLEG